MTDAVPTRNIALLIDADNASSTTFDPVLTVLAELGTVTVRRVYGNWSKPALKGWVDMSLKHGIEPQQQFDLTKGKNATDMKMTIDAMDLLYRGNVQGFGIMSSDSDFMPLATRIRQQGLPVYGFGTSRTPAPFQQACTRFIDTGVLPTEVNAPVVSLEVPLAESLPPPVGSTSSAKTVDSDLLKLLIDSYDNVKRDERGFVNLSTMGQLAANRSSFDARNYGFKRLSDLIEAVPNFTTERREGGQMFVKRIR
ncbi:MAG: NYN domain-containing protein [Sphingomonas sp.]|uniref:NYN domain-containing protein n=1 Tax=Sphingomonas sp. TaxID=28214 RepID=UPI001ACE3756|nr:NYN domain-containing protein [Sphingomonas sp.]MBN8807444.1 NYN domain-containing protein [Sphingomonas sp.]